MKLAIRARMSLSVVTFTSRGDRRPGIRTVFAFADRFGAHAFDWGDLEILTPQTG